MKAKTAEELIRCLQHMKNVFGNDLRLLIGDSSISIISPERLESIGLIEIEDEDLT